MSVSQIYGLIGYPLGHSFSKKYFSEKFEREGIENARYELFPIADVADLAKICFDHPNLRGLNVTIPHKQTVIPLLHALDETARAIGAVNVIRLRHGRLTGFNSDAYGFEQSLMPLLVKLGIFIGPSIDNGFQQRQTLEAFVLGTGGASKAVAYVLNKHNIPFRLVSRRPEQAGQLSYGDLAHARPPGKRVLWVNTTPLGTYPNATEVPPVPPDLIEAQDLVFDLIYNPEETKWMHLAAQKGAATKNGLEMLHLQAEKAWSIWQETI